MSRSLLRAVNRPCRFVLAIVILTGVLAFAQPAGETNAAGRRIYWGALIQGTPWDMNKVAAFETATGKGLGILHWGQPWWRDGAYARFDRYPFDTARGHGSIPLLDWGSWDYSLGPNQPDFQLADIISGRHDAFIRQWATDAANWGHPFFLRFNWEMNGSWQFPWSVQLNGNKPAEYVKAWRRVHGIFEKAGAHNVTWVWCPNIVGWNTYSLTSLYPGDAYVDWVAMDGYNWGLDAPSGWESFREVFKYTYDRLGVLAPNKPIMIAETSSSENGGSKASWITNTLTNQLVTNNAYPRIGAVVWFNWNADNPSLEWPLESSPASMTAARNALANQAWVGNQFQNLTTSPIPAP